MAALWMAHQTLKAAQAASTPVHLRQLELIDKMATLAASGDAITYQAVQAMNTHYTEVYDPSEEAEAKRERLKYGYEDTEDDFDLSDLDALR